ncbi:MAG TPA: hypothetical protein VN578_24295 [Candidatus Binatia bacterium]|nr:hypothetical protein [Candidatus Binatia bacterium]
MLSDPDVGVAPAASPLRDQGARDFVVELQQKLWRERLEGKSVRGDQTFYAKDLLRQERSQLGVT